MVRYVPIVICDLQYDNSHQYLVIYKLIFKNALFITKKITKNNNLKLDKCYLGQMNKILMSNK